MPLNKAFALQLGFVQRTSTILYQPTCLLHCQPGPETHMGLHPLINKFGFLVMLYALRVSWLSLSTMLSRQPQCVSPFSALWTAASSLWNFIAAMPLTVTVARLLSLVCTVLPGGLILKIKSICVIVLTSRGFYRNYSFLKWEPELKLWKCHMLLAL